MKHQHLAAVAFALVAPSLAQITGNNVDPMSNRGMASGWPAGAVVSNPSVPGIALKGPRDRLTPPASWAPVNGANDVPDYSFATLNALLQGTAMSPVEFDAISTGNGHLPGLTSDGNVTLPANWLGIAMSIADGDDGESGSLFHAQGNAGAAIVTYYLEDSSGLAPGFAGNNTLETSRTHFGFSGSGNDDITALDYGLGITSFGAQVSAPIAFGQLNRLYFSVTKDWAQTNGSITNFAMDASGTFVSPNGTDLYIIEWRATPSGTKVWFGPFVYASGDALGFDRMNGDLDAVGVDARNRAVVYSGRRVDLNQPLYGSLSSYIPQSQIMAVQLGEHMGGLPGDSSFESFTGPAVVPPVTLKDGEERVTDKGGVSDDGGGDEDEIDAICDFDPEGGMFGDEIGIPVKYDMSRGRPMGLSVSRGKYGPTGNTTDDWAFHLTGWGGQTPGLMRVGLYQYNGLLQAGDPLPALSKWGLIGSGFRYATDDALDLTQWDLPPVMDKHTAFWVRCYDPSGRIEIGASFMVSMMR